MLSLDSQHARDRYRMIVLRANASEVLLVPKLSHFILPEIEIPAFERVAKHLTAAVQREFGQQIVCLFPIRTESPNDTTYALRYYVAEAVGCRDSAQSSTWVSVDSLQLGSLADSTDYDALRSSLARSCSETQHPKMNPFEKLGWFIEVQEWIAEAIAPSGLRLRGPFHQLNASPTFSLIRFETNGPAIWFKAVGAPNQREYPISRELARLFPRFVPKILGMRDDWNAWLSIEAAGTHPDQNAEIRIWTAVAKTLARLQIASIGSTLHLINAGCRDARIPVLRDLVDPFLHAMAQLMEWQTKPNPAPLRALALQTLARQLKDALATLEESGISNTIGHFDFNPGNVIANQDHCVFLDWAEGCVGHPLLTFQYLLEHLRKIPRHGRYRERAVISSYVGSWRRLFPSDEIARALALTPLVAVFSYAAVSETWRETGRLQHPRTAAYLRSLTRRMKWQADLLAAQRVDRSAAWLA
jgi:Phosphotransferase enzyme family